MASFVLQPCHIRQDRIAPDKVEPVTLTWQELCERLAPPPVIRSEKVLSLLQMNGFVGLLRDAKGKLETFYFKSLTLSSKIDWLLKQQPQFPKQVVTLYRVERVDWGGGVAERIS